MPKSKEVSPVNPFEKKLAEIHAGQILIKNHQADQIYNTADDAFRCAYGISRTRAESGQRLWGSVGTAGNIDSAEVSYSLMIPRSRFEVRRTSRGLAERIVTLAINGDYYQPAAMIIPASPDQNRLSAAVIVGDEVNNPDHLDQVQSIVKAIDWLCLEMGRD